MAALYQFKIMLVAGQLRFFWSLQREAEFCVQLPKRGAKH